jgi:cell wall-associated NlpC family hydrolase
MHLRILCAAALATLVCAAGQASVADAVHRRQAGAEVAVRAVTHSPAGKPRSPKLSGGQWRAKLRKAHAAKRSRPRITVGERAARLARRYIGVPYAWGGANPRHGFDCSGLVMYVYSKLGVNLPHHAASQYRYGRKVSRWGLRPGDLVFFSGLGHVGLFIGNGRFIDAPQSGEVVRVASLASRSSSFVGARRLSS